MHYIEHRYGLKDEGQTLFPVEFLANQLVCKPISNTLSLTISYVNHPFSFFPLLFSSLVCKEILLSNFYFYQKNFFSQKKKSNFFLSLSRHFFGQKHSCLLIHVYKLLVVFFISLYTAVGLG
jgi:hypothetical protein